MDPKQLLRSLRSTPDREVRAQINACYPAEWAMEAVFQKSYQTYLRMQEMPQVQETARPRIALSRVIAAAALLVADALDSRISDISCMDAAGYQTRDMRHIAH